MGLLRCRVRRRDRCWHGVGAGEGTVKLEIGLGFGLDLGEFILHTCPIHPPS